MVGSCNAIKKEYISNAKFDNYEEFIDSNDFIFNADVSSLYPTAMAGFKHLYVKYPIGISRWNNQPEMEFENKKYGFYEIEYVPPYTLFFMKSYLNLSGISIFIFLFLSSSSNFSFNS